MKYSSHIFASIGILIMLLFMSLSDIDLNYYATHDDPFKTSVIENPAGCPAIGLPDYVLTGSDGACVAAAMLMLEIMNDYEVDCLFIANKGWIPLNDRDNPISRKRLEQLLADDAPY